ncbi:MAG: alpha/beta hydrolase [Bacteroidota bacterium]
MKTFTGTVTTDNATLAYRKMGKGDPLLMVHGSLDGMDSFKRQYTQFGASYSVVSISRRFHPPSTKPPEQGIYSLDQQAEDLYAVIRELQLGKPHLVSSSYGGYVAIALALKHPEVVRSLVLGEPPMLRLLDRTPEGRRAFETFHREAIEPARLSFRRGAMEDGARKFVDGIRGERGMFDAMPQGAREKLVEFAPELKLELTTELDLFMPDIGCEELQRVRVPTLLLTGEKSPALFHLIIDQLEICIPDTRRVEIPRAGHAMHIGNADAYNRTVLGFLVESCLSNT